MARADGAVRVGIAVRPRVYVPARELISREPLCSLTDQTTTGHYAPRTWEIRVCISAVRAGALRRIYTIYFSMTTEWMSH